MFKKVDHMAIAVKNLEETKKRLATLLGAKFIVENINEKGQYKWPFPAGRKYILFPGTHQPGRIRASTSSVPGRPLAHGIEVDDIKEFMDHLHAKE